LIERDSKTKKICVRVKKENDLFFDYVIYSSSTEYLRYLIDRAQNLQEVKD
jgi:hypothetical protein